MHVKCVDIDATFFKQGEEFFPTTSRTNEQILVLNFCNILVNIIFLLREFLNEAYLLGQSRACLIALSLYSSYTRIKQHQEFCIM